VFKGVDWIHLTQDSLGSIENGSLFLTRGLVFQEILCSIELVTWTCHQGLFVYLFVYLFVCLLACLPVSPNIVRPIDQLWSSSVASGKWGQVVGCYFKVCHYRFLPYEL